MQKAGRIFEECLRSFIANKKKIRKLTLLNKILIFLTGNGQIS